MVGKGNLGAAAVASEALYQAEIQKIQPLLLREAGLRQALAQLNAQAFRAADTFPDDITMQLAGRDVAWMAWVDKTRREINTELARVTARKLAAMSEIRRAFGKKEAVRLLAEKQLTDRRKQTANKFEASLLVDLMREDAGPLRYPGGRCQRSERR